MAALAADANVTDYRTEPGPALALLAPGWGMVGTEIRDPVKVPKTRNRPAAVPPLVLAYEAALRLARTAPLSDEDIHRMRRTGCAPDAWEEVLRAVRCAECERWFLPVDKSLAICCGEVCRQRRHRAGRSEPAGTWQGPAAAIRPTRPVDSVPADLRDGESVTGAVRPRNTEESAPGIADYVLSGPTHTADGASVRVPLGMPRIPKNGRALVGQRDRPPDWDRPALVTAP